MKPTLEEDRLLEIRKQMAILQIEAAKLFREASKICGKDDLGAGEEGMMEIARESLYHWNKFVELTEYTLKRGI